MEEITTKDFNHFQNEMQGSIKKLDTKPFK